jgi:hypothetical protein
MKDQRLAAVLQREDLAEDSGSLDPMDRVTCRLHCRWLHSCVGSASHANPATGHRWCRRCGQIALIAVDELTSEISIRCERCGRMPGGRANRQLMDLCRRSMLMSRSPANISETVVLHRFSQREVARLP